MAIENIPVWPFEPNWSSTLTEVLEWLTDVMTSPTGSEQRRSLRYFPRRTFEYTLAAAGDERTLLDNLLISYSAQRWYLPLWHDVNFTEAAIAVGQKIVPCSTVSTSKIVPGSVAILIGDSPYDTELVEVESVDGSGLTLTTAVSRAWPNGSRLYSTRIAKFTDQPEPSKRSDAVVTSEVRFQIVEANRDHEEVVTLDVYRGFPVLPLEPDERTPLNNGIERMLVELDNQTSIPIWRDTASKPFTYQQYAWVLEGRSELTQFENLLQVLRGRAQPLWVPTFMQDMVLAASVAANAQTLVVQRCGFTLTGGPRPDRQDIMIETAAGRIYRRITASAFNSQGQEVIAIDSPIPSGFSPSAVVRICFIILMRLNQDSITIEHQTDTDGVATALVTFRSAPNTRIPITADF